MRPRFFSLTRHQIGEGGGLGMEDHLDVVLLELGAEQLGDRHGAAPEKACRRGK